MLDFKFNDKLTDVFESFKVVTPALIAVAISTGFLIFLPTSVLERMALDDIPDGWRAAIGMVFLISVTLILTIAIVGLCKQIYRSYQNRSVVRRLRAKFEKLSADQKELLIYMLRSSDKSLRLDPTDGDVVYLKNAGFINQADKGWFFGPGYIEPVRFTPQPWLMEFYLEEPEKFNLE